LNLADLAPAGDEEAILISEVFEYGVSKRGAPGFWHVNEHERMARKIEGRWLIKHRASLQFGLPTDRSRVRSAAGAQKFGGLQL
jgi:hypothetical protein